MPPICKFLDECGSCTLDMPYEEQVEFKKELIKREFEPFFTGKFEFFASPPVRYRNRAEFKIYHDELGLSYAMSGKEAKFVPIDECAKVNLKIANLMNPLLEFIASDEQLSARLFGMEFITSANNVLVVLLYHKDISNLADKFESLAAKFGVFVTARSKGKKLSIGAQTLQDELNINGRVYKFVFGEGAFIQPNTAVNEKMIAWAQKCVDECADMDGGQECVNLDECGGEQMYLDVNVRSRSGAGGEQICASGSADSWRRLNLDDNTRVQSQTGTGEPSRKSIDERQICAGADERVSKPRADINSYLNLNTSAQIQTDIDEPSADTQDTINVKKGDLLELYCGHGNFTIPLAGKFRRVLATEISKSSIANALKNCELNGVTNIKFLRMSAGELMSAFAKERKFNRLKGINLDDFSFSHVLVDPPRAGLETSVIDFIKNYENIIYISCSPQSLKRDLVELARTHEAVKFGIFDQFANTLHIECGVLLRKKYER